MANSDDIDTIVRIFHRTPVIEDSRFTPVPKKDVLQARAAAEREAARRLKERWGVWQGNDLGTIIDCVNLNGFGDANKRFSKQFEDNLKQIEKVGIEQTRVALLELLREDIPVTERILHFKESYGSEARGLYSSILYLLDPTRYSPLFAPIVDSLNRFDLNHGHPLTTKIQDYERYCGCMKEFERDYGISPQLSDYVLTTWIDVHGKYRHLLRE